jgi:hypothetical protein
MQVHGKTRKDRVAIVPCAPVAIVAATAVVWFLTDSLAATELPVRYDAIASGVRVHPNDPGYRWMFMD